MALSWSKVRREFEFDGSWRDICVVDTSLHHWQLLLDALRVSNYPTTYTIGWTRAELPTRAADAFASSEHDDLRMLSVNAGGVVLNSHFFDETEIEFDLDPREVSGQAELDAIILFMQTVARACRRPVILTPENLHEVTIIRVDEGGAVHYQR